MRRSASERTRTCGSPTWARPTEMLRLEAINTYYGDSHTLRGVSLDLPAGTALGLLGRNGMGKTTLIRALMGYVPVAAGAVHWHGRTMTNAPPERMARLGIGYVPEGRG